MKDILLKKVLENCWEYEYGSLSSFGWVVNKEAQEICLTEIDVASVIVPSIPPLLHPKPEIDLFIHKEIQKKETNLPLKITIQQ